MAVILTAGQRVLGVATKHYCTGPLTKTMTLWPASWLGGASCGHAAILCLLFHLERTFAGFSFLYPSHTDHCLSRSSPVWIEFLGRDWLSSGTCTKEALRLGNLIPIWLYAIKSAPWDQVIRPNRQARPFTSWYFILYPRLLLSAILNASCIGLVCCSFAPFLLHVLALTVLKH